MFASLAFVALLFGAPSYAAASVRGSADVDGVRLVACDAGGEMASACVLVGVGTSYEDASSQGITSLLNHVIVSANPSSPGESSALEIERLGGTVGVKTGMDYSAFTLAAPEKNLAAALEALCRALAEPHLDEATLRAVKRYLDGMSELEKDVPVQYCYRLLSQGADAGRKGGAGDPFEGLGLNELSGWYKRYYRSGNVVVSVCSGSSLKAIEAAVKAGSGSLPKGPAPDARPAAMTRETGASRFDCSVKSPCSAALMAFGAPPIGSRDYPAARVAESAVAFGMGSKMFRSLRVDDGLAYTFGSIHDASLSGSRVAFYVNTMTGNVEPSVAGITGSVDALRRGELTASELVRAKGKARGELALAGDGVVERAWRAGVAELFGLGSGYWEKLDAGIASVGSDDVVGAARKYMDACTLVVTKPLARTR